MPFDGTNFGTPSLRTLADVLRCRGRPVVFLHAFGLSSSEAWSIFACTPPAKGNRMGDVQPEHVADAIDAYLSRAE